MLDTFLHKFPIFFQTVGRFLIEALQSFHIMSIFHQIFVKNGFCEVFPIQPRIVLILFTISKHELSRISMPINIEKSNIISKSVKANQVSHRKIKNKDKYFHHVIQNCYVKLLEVSGFIFFIYRRRIR